MGLRHAEQIRGEADCIATLVAGREVGPPARAHIDLERAEVLIGARWITRNPLASLLLSIGKPLTDNYRQIWQRALSDDAKVDATTTLAARRRGS